MICGEERLKRAGVYLKQVAQILKLLREEGDGGASWEGSKEHIKNKPYPCNWAKILKLLGWGSFWGREEGVHLKISLTFLIVLKY